MTPEEMKQIATPRARALITGAIEGRLTGEIDLLSAGTNELAEALRGFRVTETELPVLLAEMLTAGDLLALDVLETWAEETGANVLDLWRRVLARY